MQPSLLIAALLLLCRAITTPALRADVPVAAVHLRVTILLLNFDINRHFSAGDLAQLLRDVMPFYSPREVRDVVFEITYSVHSDLSLSPASSAYGKHGNNGTVFMSMYEMFLDDAFKSGGASSSNKKKDNSSNNNNTAVVELSTKQLSHFLRSVIKQNDNSVVNLEASLTNLPFIIINGDASSSHHIKPRSHRFTVPTHSHGGSEGAQYMCTQHFIGSVLFLDSSAEFCTNNIVSSSDGSDRIETHRLSSDISSGYMKRFTAPYAASPFPLHFPNERTGPNNNGIFDELKKDPLIVRNYFKSQIASVVTSGIKQTVVGSLRYKTSQRKERIVVPVIFIDNVPLTAKATAAVPMAADTDDAIDARQEVFIDTQQVARYVQRHLLPSQELVLLQSHHNVFEHPQISVVLASAQLQYKSYSPRDNLIETVPYISAEVFFREMTAKVSDSLVGRLMTKTGHATAYYLSDVTKSSASKRNGAYRARDAAASRERIGAWIKQSVTMSSSSYGDEDASNAKSDVAIVPVFVLSNLYFHNTSTSESDSGPGLGSSPADRDSFNIQPLIDKDRLVGFDSDYGAAVIIHSSANTSADLSGRVMYYDTNSNGYNAIDTSDINQLVAEAALTALTGLSAPHINTHDSGGADYTWSFGNHPFHEYGLADFSIPTEGDSDNDGDDGRGISEWSAARTIVTSRVHSAMFMALQLGARAAEIIAEVRDALASLQAVSDVSAKQGSGRELEDLVRLYARFDKLIIDNDKSMSKIKKTMGASASSADGLGLGSSDMLKGLLVELGSFEKAVTRHKRLLLSSERSVYDNLRECKVLYDISTISSSSEGPSAARVNYKRYLRGWSGAAITALLLATIGGFVYGMQAMQLRVAERSKKNK